MKINDIDKSIFTVNKDAKITVIPYKETNTNIILVDDFYKYPDKVREFVLNAPAVDFVKNTFPGLKSKTRLFLHDYLYDFINDLILRYFLDRDIKNGRYNWTNKDIKNITDIKLNKDTFDYVTFNFVKSEHMYPENRYDKNNEIGGSLCTPHVDYKYEWGGHQNNLLYAGLVYLNTPDEYNSYTNGTGIYRHRGTNLYQIDHDTIDNYTPPDNFKSGDCGGGGKNRNLYLIDFKNDVLFGKDKFFCNNNDIFLNDGDDDWELMHLMKMKYNRLAFYPTSLFHAYYIKDKAWVDNFRIVQTIWGYMQWDYHELGEYKHAFSIGNK